MRTWEVEIGDHTYSGQTASAKNQFEALHIAGRTGLLAALQGKVSDMAMVGILLQIPLEDVYRLRDLLLKGLVQRGEVPVAENLFQDDIQNFYLLLAVTIRENLVGFWKLRRQTEEKSAEQNS